MTTIRTYTKELAVDFEGDDALVDGKNAYLVEVNLWVIPITK